MTISRMHFGWLSWFAAVLVLTCKSQLFAIDDHGRELRPTSWQLDATINDVFFINEMQGWAVGDQGLILRTNNGGRDWSKSENAGLDLDDHRSFEDKLFNMRPLTQTHELYPLTCSLKSVFFLNERQGWIAGNYFTPLLERSHSVLLRTDDGGKSWRVLKSNFLPQINRIHFQDVLGGWAIGRSGSLYKSGVFTTSSGGSNWSSQTIDPVSNWSDADLVPSGFVVIDDQGRLGKITGKAFEPAVVIGRRPGKMRSVRMLNAKKGWAVGTAGTVLNTDDGGHSWKYLDLLESSTTVRQFDFATVAITDGRVWFAGNPGTLLISINPKDLTDLRFHETPVPIPITKIHFADVKHGWAVGLNGLILATSDQGQNWEIQRMADERVGMLVASPTTKNLPFGLLSNLANEKGIISGSVVLGQHDELHLQMAASATNRVGCGVNLEMHCGNHSQKLESTASSRELELLVRTIRTLRPNVLVSNSFVQTHPEMNSKFIVRCHTAIELAADATAFPDQIEAAHLSTWQVDRFLIRTGTATGELNLDGNQYLPMSGTLLEDQISLSRSLVGLSPVYRDPESYRIESFTGSVSANRNDIFFGLKQLGRHIPTRSDITRRGNLGSLATAPLKHKELARLRNWPTDSPDQVTELHRQIQSFGNGQESRELGIWLWQLADEFLQAGKLELAAFALEKLVNRVGDHSLAPAALVWLTNYYSSSEFGASIFADYQSEVANKVAPDPDESEIPIPLAQTIPTTIDGAGVQTVAWTPAGTDANDGTIATAELIEDSIASAKTARTQLASRFLYRLKQRDPDLAQSELIQFMEASLARQIPGELSNNNLLKKIRRTSSLNSEFAFAASRELRSTDKRVDDRYPVCIAAKTRPTLDGNLDDDLWQHAVENGDALLKAMKPTSEKETARTDVVWLAYDEEFLFIAVRCTRDPNAKFRPVESVRSRDAELNNADRIQIVLDFDRDLQSGFLFEIDSRGRVFESCGGSAGWNPDWYVAAGMSERAWSIECAIPLSELTPDAINESTLIAFACRRLNANSIDLWSDEDPRESHQADLGIVAGLKIRPNRFEFLRFAAPLDPNNTEPQLK